MWTFSINNFQKVFNNTNNNIIRILVGFIYKLYLKKHYTSFIFIKLGKI